MSFMSGFTEFLGIVIFITCVFCFGGFIVFICPKYKSLSRPERFIVWKTVFLCLVFMTLMAVSFFVDLHPLVFMAEWLMSGYLILKLKTFLEKEIISKGRSL